MAVSNRIGARHSVLLLLDCITNVVLTMAGALYGGALLLFKNVAVKIELPKFGAPTVTAYKKNTPAGGARFRADDAWHTLMARDWATADGELVRLGVGMSAQSVPADAVPVGRSAVWLARDSGEVLAIPDAVRNARKSVKRMKSYALNHQWSYFFTQTFSAALLASRGFLSRYDLRIIATWRRDLERLRRVYLKRGWGRLEYLTVPELHQDGAIHIHFLVSGLDARALVPSLYPSGDVRLDRAGRPQWRWLDLSRRWGFCDGSEVGDVERVARYVSKYISKSFDASRSWASALDDGTLDAVAVADGVPVSMLAGVRDALPGVSVLGVGFRRWSVSSGVEPAPVVVGDGIDIDIDDGHDWFGVTEDGIAGAVDTLPADAELVLISRRGDWSAGWFLALLDACIDVDAGLPVPVRPPAERRALVGRLLESYRNSRGVLL